MTSLTNKLASMRCLAMRLLILPRFFSAHSIIAEKGQFGRHLLGLPAQSLNPKRTKSGIAVRVLRPGRRSSDHRSSSSGSNTVDSRKQINMVKAVKDAARRRVNTSQNISMSDSLDEAAQDSATAQNVEQSSHEEVESPTTSEVLAASTADRDAVQLDTDIRTVREAVFGSQAPEEDEQSEWTADSELLSRVQVKEGKSNMHIVSKKVVHPYTTYGAHRNRWAEFRRRMIYGRSEF